jgi:sperm-associated antigen 16 protein
VGLQPRSMTDLEDDLAVVERVELSDSDDDEFDYAGVEVRALPAHGTTAHSNKQVEHCSTHLIATPNISIVITLKQEDELPLSDDESEEDLTAALASLQQRREALDSGRVKRHHTSDSYGTADTDASSAGTPQAITQLRPAVADDFIRNFLIKAGMHRALDAFNTEWYELQAKGRLGAEHSSAVPDIYLRNEELAAQVTELRAQLTHTQEITERAQGTWDKFRKERDFHRLHHKRVVQEKARLVTDLKRLKKHFKAYEPTLAELQRKYQIAMKEKMLIKLERDRLKAKAEAAEAQLSAGAGDDEGAGGPHRRRGGSSSGLSPELSVRHSSRQKGSGATAATGSGGTRNGSTLTRTSTSALSQQPSLGGRRKNDSKLPPADSCNPLAELSFPAPEVERFSLKKSFKGHLNAVAAVAFHPRKDIIATASDDETWKVWSLPDCELIMSGEGHRNWIAGVAFHPEGTSLATASGDGTVKLWDFKRAACAATFEDHTAAVWAVAWHHGGDFLASCSMDHTARLWDVHSERCRQTFRGHVDSVNAVCWQPHTATVCTGSGDKTVSLWDARSGLCVQTFYGHSNAVNDVAVALRGDTVASCDADGAVKLWDVRMVAERATLGPVGQHPLNKVCFDRSGSRVAAASGDGTVKVFDAESRAVVVELRGHEDAVQSVVFSPADDFLVSAASDCTFRVWS